MPTIQASVNARLLTKAGRFFTGTLEGRIIEILQNARRAGASSVEITHHADYVTVRDNGRGVDDFANLLDLGGSGWDEAREASEDPAGVGLFCLAPREVLIRSKWPDWRADRRRRLDRRAGYHRGRSRVDRRHTAAFPRRRVGHVRRRATGGFHRHESHRRRPALRTGVVCLRRSDAPPRTGLPDRDPRDRPARRLAPKRVRETWLRTTTTCWSTSTVRS